MLPFDRWLELFPWLHDRDRPCVISADLDGMACGMFQQEHLNWKIVGTYDGNRLSLWEAADAIDWNAVVFLDLEILRPEAKSIGNHLLLAEAAGVDEFRTKFPHCANPNLWRRISVWEGFQQKFPFGTLPLVIAAHLLRQPDYRVPEAWLALLLQTDSGFTNAATYQANALAWLADMRNTSRPGAIGRLCDVLARLPAIVAMSMVEKVQSWAEQAGYGGKQRACRFDVAKDDSRERALRLAKVIQTNAQTRAIPPFDRKPYLTEEYETGCMPSKTLQGLRAGVAFVERARVISMAFTARNEEGLSYTLPKADSAVPLFR